MDDIWSNASFFSDGQFYLSLLLGLTLGSLATAMAYRLPRGISMITQERSHCPHCNRVLTVLDLFPVASWLFLRGRCRGCARPYGLRYLGIELATLALCVAFYMALPAGPALVAFYFAAAVLVAHVAIDFEWQLLLDKLNLSLAALAVLAIVLICNMLPLDGDAPLWDVAARMSLLSLAGGVIYAAVSAAVRWLGARVLGREPMGLGDVKFFAAAGMWLGPDVMTLATFMILSGLTGIALGLFWRWRYGAAAFPFGPALIAAFTGLLLTGHGPIVAAMKMYGNAF